MKVRITYYKDDMDSDTYEGESLEAIYAQVLSELGYYVLAEDDTIVQSQL